MQNPVIHMHDTPMKKERPRVCSKVRGKVVSQVVRLDMTQKCGLTFILIGIPAPKRSIW
jgi:hypothetical protein